MHENIFVYNSKKVKTTQMLIDREWITNTSLLIHKTEFHVAVKRYILYLYVFTWINLKNMISKTAFKNILYCLYIFLNNTFKK